MPPRLSTLAARVSFAVSARPTPAPRNCQRRLFLLTLTAPHPVPFPSPSPEAASCCLTTSSLPWCHTTIIPGMNLLPPQYECLPAGGDKDSNTAPRVPNMLPWAEAPGHPLPGNLSPGWPALVGRMLFGRHTGNPLPPTWWPESLDGGSAPTFMARRARWQGRPDPRAPHSPCGT